MTQKTGPETPLEFLAHQLQQEMKEVNALILARLDSDVALIPQIARYLIMAGGKRIRPLLTLAATRLYSADSDRPYRLAAAVEFIHTATLLHDDVVDESDERRGQESAPIVFGNQSSVLVGDFLFSRAFQLMVEDGSLDVLDVLSQASAVIAEGEVMQLQTANNIETGLDDYLKVIGAKTAALFAAACEIGPIIAGAEETHRKALRDYGYNLGMAFQIADDVLDYNADRVKLGKTVGDDFREGKMTAPLIFALQDGDDKEHDFWQRTIAEKAQKPADLDEALLILARHDSLKKGIALAEQYIKKAEEALACAPDHILKQPLKDLITYSVYRDH